MSDVLGQCKLVECKRMKKHEDHCEWWCKCPYCYEEVIFRTNTDCEVDFDYALVCDHFTGCINGIHGQIDMVFATPEIAKVFRDGYYKSQDPCKIRNKNIDVIIRWSDCKEEGVREHGRFTMWSCICPLCQKVIDFEKDKDNSILFDEYEVCPHFSGVIRWCKFRLQSAFLDEANATIVRYVIWERDNPMD